MLPPIIILGTLGLLFGIGLFIASRVFYVRTDPRVDNVLGVLPGTNCGACGLPGCSGLAKAIVHGSAGVESCVAGGEEVSHLIADIMGVEAKTVEKNVAVLMCRGVNVPTRFEYQGIETCIAANGLQGGPKACTYGCMGYGDCVEVCPFDAIWMVEGLPYVDEVRCTGCGNCVEACPKNLFILQPLSKMVHVTCMSRAKPKEVRAVCKVGCIGCKKCEKVCKFDAIQIKDFLAEIDYEKCTSCGLCVKECPTDSIIGPT